MRHTRDCRAGRPVPYFVLHRIGFSLPPASLPARWALTPPFHPCRLCHLKSEIRDYRGAVFSLWHFPSRRFDPPCPGLSGSASGRWPCGLPHRRDDVSCRESCPMVSGLSSPNRLEGPGFPKPQACLARHYPRGRDVSKERSDDLAPRPRKGETAKSRGLNQAPRCPGPDVRGQTGSRDPPSPTPPNRRSGCTGRKSPACRACASRCRR
jgi:hypothetical protein